MLSQKLFIIFLKRNCLKFLRTPTKPGYDILKLVNIFVQFDLPRVMQNFVIAVKNYAKTDVDYFEWNIPKRFLSRVSFFWRIHHKKLKQPAWLLSHRWKFRLVASKNCCYYKKYGNIAPLARLLPCLYRLLEYTAWIKIPSCYVLYINCIGISCIEVRRKTSLSFKRFFAHKEQFWNKLENKFIFLALTHFRLIFRFYIPWKCQKTSSFLTFSGDIEREHWPEMG